MNPEKVKRLAPLPPTLRKLFLTSGNYCAFPGCTTLMMDIEGNFVGQICHIEAAEEGGERFNPAMSNEDRRQAENLMLMCYPHHVKTNDVVEYQVGRMKEMKANHEKRFANPDTSMLRSIKDWTRDQNVALPVNLNHFVEIMDLKQLDQEDIDGMVKELGVYLTEFQKVPVQTRKMVGEWWEKLPGALFT